MKAPEAQKRPGSDAIPMRVRIVPSRVELVLGVGLALYFAWIDCMFYSSKNVSATTVGPSFSTEAVYYVSIATLCSCLLAMALRPKRAGVMLFGGRALVAAPVGMGISALLMPLASFGNPLGVGAIALCGTLSGVTSCMCLMQWGATSSCLESREIVMTGAVAYALSYFVSTGFHALMDAQDSGLGSSLVILGLLGVALPLGSGTTLSHFAQKESIPLAEASVGNASPDVAGEEREARRIVYRIAGALVLIGFVLYSSWDLGFRLLGQEGKLSRSSLIYLEIALMVLIVAAGIAAAFAAKHPQRSVPACYRAIVLLSVLSVCLIPSALIMPKPTVTLTSACTSGMLNGLHLLMWITTVGICRRYRGHTVEYLATMRLGWAIGPLLGSLFSAVAARAGIGLSLLYLHMTACVVALFLVYSTVLPEAALVEALSIMPKKYRRPFKERCRVAAQMYGLTNRQLEIMMLFAKGRDSAYIQQELCLSKSTVSTHRQHIYGKLGVHSQQELLNKLYELEPPAEE